MPCAIQEQTPVELHIEVADSLMDALSQTLRVVHLVGAIFINAKFTAPWCYRSQRADSVAPLLEPGAERVVIFHLITEGECYVEMDGQPPLRLIAGDAVLFPQGDAHLMTSQPGLSPRRARGSTQCSRAGRDCWHSAAAGATTRLLCGYLACEARLAKMLLAGLPPIVRVNVRGSNAGAWLEASVRYALAEARSPRPGGAGVLAKLAEVLFIETLRLYMHEQSEGRTGWLAGVGDRIVGAALARSSQASRAGLDARRSRARGRHFAFRARRAIPAAGRHLADAVPHPVAHDAGGQSPAS